MMKFLSAMWCHDLAGRHEARRSNGEWQRVTFVEHCYYSPQNDSIYYENDIHSKRFKHLAENYNVDFPSMMFVYLPDKKDKAIYDRIKVMSNLLGIQTQCAVKEKFEGQRNKEQYASNIATKINAKLSTVHDKAISWTSSCDNGSNENQLPWVGERPTLVVGAGIVHGMFKSVVAASNCLDKGCMRLSHSCFIQEKSDCISDLIMTDIMKIAIDVYEIDNKYSPERVLFLRDGISDGNFQQAGVEIEAIRKALAQSLPGRSIPITFVVCQSQQQGFKMVPVKSIRDFRDKTVTNVSSGTSLQCGDSSYYLVAQGGLKGTSKPVKHIVIINENECPVETLKNLTYQMCYKYPTATKAVREVPLIKYAKKLANQVFSSIR
jgi:eukaryotic translation initiation factor 2C